MNNDFDWETLRQDVAEVQRPFTDDPDALRRERARLLLATGNVKPRSRFQLAAKTWTLLAAAAIALVVTGAALRSSNDDAPLSFRAGDATGPTPLAVWLAPSGAAELPVRFSDGTLVSLAPASQARVIQTTAHGADILLEQGSLRVSVVHRASSEWHIAAGPFRVLVTGTKFDVAWNASQQRFLLALHEGRVKVDGPTLGPDGRWVKVGEQLRAELNGSPTPRAAAESSPSTSPVDPEKAAPAKVDGTQARAKGWKELAEHRQYGEALAAAEAAGFEASCRAASASDLVLLGNAARFAGSAARAEQAFRLVRSRFAGTAQASMAAFYLGRIAYDQVGDRRQAAEWFQSYLREAPGGALAREAAGRLLEAQRALGDRNAARAAARSYLQQYPSGPHAALAHEVLQP